jgi:tetratricopeptide (TPR) repeat protein
LTFDAGLFGRFVTQKGSEEIPVKMKHSAALKSWTTAVAVFGVLSIGLARAAQKPAPTETDRLVLAADAALNARNYVEADRLYSAVLRQYEAQGIDGSRLAAVLVRLGFARKVQGRYGESTDLILLGVQTLENAPASDRAGLGTAWQMLGTAYYTQHLYTKAEHAYERALEIQKQDLPARDAEAIEVLSSLGAVYVREQRFTEAEAAFQKAQGILESIPQPDPGTQALLMNNLGSLYWGMERYREAASVLSRGLPVAEQANDPTHILTVHMLGNLAIAHQALKEYQEAATLFARVMEFLDKDILVEPDEAARLYQRYAVCLRKLGNRNEAKKMEARAKTLLSTQPRDLTTELVVDASQFRRER